PPGISCPMHKKPCNLVPKHIVFLFFLFVKVGDIDKCEELEGEAVTGPPSVATISQIADVEVFDEIDTNAEAKESASLDVALFKAQTINEDISEDVELTEASTTVPSLPFFHVNGKDFILIHHIQCLFNMREDYCLATIPESSVVAKDFVDIEEEPHEEFLKLD